MARCRFTGGRGGFGVPIVCPPGANGYSIGGPAGTKRVTSDCVLSGASPNTVLIPPLPELAAPPSAARGMPVTLTLSGLPGTVVLLYLDGIHQHLPIPGIDGPLLVTLAAHGLGLQSVGGGGSTPLVMQVPQDQGLQHRFVFFQGVALEPAAPFPSLTNLAAIRIR
jgi:hypothetical protein